MRFGVTCRYRERWTKVDRIFLCYLDGFSQAELVHISESASAAEPRRPPSMLPGLTEESQAALQRGCKEGRSWRARSSSVGNLGPHIASREQLSARSLLCRLGFARMDESRTILQGQNVGGRWVRGLSVPPRASPQSLPVFWDWIHPEELRAHSRASLRVNGRLRPSGHFVLACVCGRSARQGPCSSLEWGVAALSRRFTSQWKERPQRVLQASWPDVHLVDRVADLSNATLPQIVEKGPHVRMWIVGASLPSNLLTAHQEIPRLDSYGSWSLMPKSLLSQSAPRTLVWKSVIKLRVLRTSNPSKCDPPRAVP